MNARKISKWFNGIICASVLGASGMVIYTFVKPSPLEQLAECTSNCAYDYKKQSKQLRKEYESQEVVDSPIVDSEDVCDANYDSEVALLEIKLELAYVTRQLDQIDLYLDQIDLYLEKRANIKKALGNCLESCTESIK